MRGAGAVLSVALLGLLLVGAAQGQSAHWPARFRGVITAGNNAGHNLRLRLFAASSRTAGANNLSYHGGPVMHSDANYSVYWEPSGYSTSASYKTVIDGYFANVGAASGATSNDYSVATQYYDNGGSIAYQASFGKRIVDSTPYPASGCTSTGGQPCLTDAQMQSELSTLISNQGLPQGTGTIYYIFTPPNVATCFDSTGTDCSSGGAHFDYCAYHSSLGSGSGTTLYAVMPYAGVSGCDSGQHPNGDPADATLNVTSHENIEAITDPLGTAWYDSSGQEIGDKCAWNFGSPLGGSSGAEYNEQISSGNYYLQQEWSNASSGCVQRLGSSSGGGGGGGAPVAAFTYSASGRRVRFSASGSSDTGATITRYSWSFGDGSSGTGVGPTHTYRNTASYTVKLTVTDSAGKTASVSKTITS